MDIRLDRTKPVPLARQIEAQLERLIRERYLAPGIKLPATRELARTLAVNRGTVALAYEELVAAGLARAHVGQGTFVADPPAADGRHAMSAASGATPGLTGAPAVASAAPLDWSALFSRSAQVIEAEAERARTLSGTLPSREDAISFAGGMPDSGLFPTDAFRRVLNQVVREEGETLLQYYPVGGYPPLRRYLAGYLMRFGVEVRPEQIVVVNGSQQGFDLVARTLLDPGDLVAIEQPTYPRAVQVFRAFGAQLVTVPWDTGGPRLDVLERVLERHAPKLFYCQPSGHNPTGLSMSAATRDRLLALARQRQLPIVEDGFDPSLHYGPRPASPLKAYDRDDAVIYIGTFSKVLFPGLRLGWLVAPPPLVDRLQAAKQLADLHTSALIQAAVHRFCERRLLDRHVARVAAEYARRRDLLLAALRRRMPDGVTWTEPHGGFSLLVTLPGGLDTAELGPRALARGVAFTPGAAFFVDEGGARTLRLSFSSVPADRIDDGVRRLSEAVRELSQRPAHRAASRGALVPLV